MKIFKISQTRTRRRRWDYYDSAVVVAESVEGAQKIHPGRDITWPACVTNMDDHLATPEWVDNPNDVTVVYLGEADPALTEGTVLCASFNAG